MEICSQCGLFAIAYMRCVKSGLRFIQIALFSHFIFSKNDVHFFRFIYSMMMGRLTPLEEGINYSSIFYERVQCCGMLKSVIEIASLEWMCCK